MPRKKVEGDTRQVYASIREALSFAAKARATELRIPLRELIEMGLELALTGSHQPQAQKKPTPSIWDDEYLDMQAGQPVGSPVEMTPEEAERVVREAFGPAQDSL